MTRRSSFEGPSVSYGCAGITRAPEFRRYIPSGYRGFERTTRLGSGFRRFSKAREQMMAWRLQRDAGLDLEILEPGEVNYYSEINTTGAAPLFDQGEQVVDAEGFGFVAPGMVIRLRSSIKKFIKLKSQYRVIYAIVSPRRVGFGYGAITVTSPHLEEGFFLEHRPDDSVWFTVRMLVNHSWLGPLSWRRSFGRDVLKRYMRVLQPGYAN